MLGATRILVEKTVTVRAFIGFFTRMRPNVNSQTARFLETRTAVFTRMRTLFLALRFEEYSGAAFFDW